MPINTEPRYIGRAWITPDGPVVAGQYGTWTLGYEAGAYGYDERARLKIGSRFASDWGTPQFTDPGGANYTTVRLESRCAWVSNTTGDDDGLDLTLDAPPHAVLRFRTPVIDLDVPLSDLADGTTRTFPAGGIDLRVFVRRLPTRGHRSRRSSAAARHLRRLLDLRDARGRRPSLDQPRVSRRGLT